MKPKTSEKDRKLRSVRTEVPGRTPQRVIAGFISVIALMFMGVSPAIAVEPPDPLDDSSTPTEELLSALQSNSDVSVQSGDLSDEDDPPPIAANNIDPDAPQSGDLDDEEQSGTDDPPVVKKSLGDVGIMAVGDATVTVTARTFGAVNSVNTPQIGANTGNTDGATYELYRVTGTGNNKAPGAATGLSCTITAAGKCTIDVPAAQADQSYFVVQTAAAAGTYFNTYFNLGDATTPSVGTYYQGLTPNLNNNKSVDMPTDAINQKTTGAPLASSFGAVLNSYANPRLSASCQAGVNIAVVLDVSGSMGASVGGGKTRLTLLKETFNDPTDGIFAALNGSPIRLGFFNFNTNSPGAGNTNGWNKPTPQAVTNSNIGTMRSWINGLSTGSGLTNWDQALRAVSTANSGLSAGDKYDVVVFVTDGAPNYIVGSGGSGGQGPNGSNVTIRSLEAAIYSANTIKAGGMRLIGYGIAQGNTGAANAKENLRAISGPSEGSDYFVADVDALREYLRGLFGSLACDIPITVSKFVPGTTANSWVPKSGWEMSVEQVPGTDGTLASPSSTTTGTNGTAGPWVLRLDDQGELGGVTVSEASVPGWQNVNAEYVLSNVITGDDPTTFPLPSSGQIGDLTPGDRVEVKFYNEQISDPTLEKTFTSVTNAGDGKFNVNYLLKVTGANHNLTYDIADVPQFAPGVTLVQGSAHMIDNPVDHNDQSEVFTIPGSGGKFRTSVPLNANEVHYYHVVWEVSVDNNQVGDHTECSPNGAGNGYFNTATLYAGDDEFEDDACGPIKLSIIPQLSKSVDSGSPSQNSDGTWTVNYTVTATLPTSAADNPEKLDGVYDLVDTLNFGGGITIDSATWTGPGSTTGSFTGNTATMATEVVLPYASPVHTYHVTVKASIDDEDVDATTDSCKPSQTGGGAGFLNQALLTSAGVERTAEDCGVPVLDAPTVTKTAAASTPNADGSWTVSYQVKVTNTSSADLHYALTDQVAPVPSGADWLDGSIWNVTGPTVTPSGGGSATINPLWNGSGDLASGKISAGATHTFQLSRSIVLESTSSWDDLACVQTDHSKGIWNSVTVTNGVRTNGPAEACAEVLAPRINVEKTVASVKQNSDGSWTVTYGVSVKNTGNAPGSFGLNDVPNFGTGFTITSQGWAGDPADAPGSGPADNYILHGQTLNYQYAVTATFDPEVSDPGLTCQADGGKGAFMNQINLESDSGPDSDTACAEPLSPTVNKAVSSVTQDAVTGNWTVAYTVTVTAPKPADTDVTQIAYTLSDTAAALPTGVTRVGDWTVAGPAALNDGSYTAASPAWNGSGVVGNGTLPVGKNHVFTFSQVLTVGANALPGDLDCEEDGKGIINEAAVTNGIGSDTSKDCGSLKAGSWKVTKSSNPASGTKVAPGDTITYTVTVTNTSEAGVVGVKVTDDLSAVVDNAVLDTSDLPSGATFDGIDTITWDIGALAAGASKTMTYKATVNADAYGVTLKNVATGEGSVPPETCPAGSTACSTTHHTDPAWTLGKSSTPASGSTVAPGDTITYTLTVKSLSKDADVTAVTVKDDLTAVVAYADLDEGSLPAGATYDSATKILTWTVGTLTKGQTKTLSYDALVKADAYGVTLKNVATGEGSVPPETCPAGSTACSTTHDTDPSWTLVKSSDPVSGSKVAPGSDITYTVTATSLSKVKTINGVVIIDDLSGVVNHAVLDESSLPADVTYDAATQELTWDLGSLLAGTSKSISYTVTVDEDAYGVTIDNHVTPGADTPPPGPCEGDTDCRTTNHYTDPAWTLVKSSDPVSGSTVAPGSTVKYTVTAKNLSLEATLSGAVAVDDLSAVLSHAELVEPLGGGLSASGDTLTWSIPDLAPGAAASATYEVVVDNDAIGVTIRNVVTGGGDVPPPTDCVDDTDCRTTEHHTPAWTLVKSSDPVSGSTVAPGSTVTYTLSVENTSDADLEGAKAIDDVSGVVDHATVVASSLPASVVYDAAAKTLTWDVPDLGPGDTASVSYQVKVGDDAVGVTIRNVVTGGGDVPPPTDCVDDTDCRTTEHHTPAWTLVKSSDPVSGSTVAPGSTVTYTLSVENTSDADLKGAKAIDDVSGVVDHATVVAGSLPAGVTYEAVAKTLTWDVPDLGPGETASVSYQVKVDDDAVGVTIRNVVTGGGDVPPPTDCEDDTDCRTTEHHTPELKVDKEVVSAAQQPDGTWKVLYQVKVTNVAGFATTYTLTDTLNFGAGISVDSATWTGPTSGTFTGSTATLADDLAMPSGNATHVYEVEVHASVTPGAWTDAEAELACPGDYQEGSGGFFNKASLTFPGSSDEAEACTEPGRPTINKVFDSATQNPLDPAEWTVAYTITVAGDDQWPTVYDLADVPGFASGATPVNGVSQRTDTDPEGPQVPIGPDGIIATGVGLAAGATHTYSVSWVVDVPNGVNPSVEECTIPGTAGNGFFNEAVLTSGGSEQTSDACGPIDTIVRPNVTKTVTNTVQNDDGTWAVEYNIEVLLPTGEDANPKGLSAKYDLDDTLNFGGGITVEDATWSGGPAGAVDQPFTDGSATLAAGVVISPEDPLHTYSVWVTANVATEAFEEGTHRCDADAEDGSGFLNTATLTSAGSESDAHACSEPAAPSATKTGQTPVQNDDGTWTVSYLVTLTNASGLDLVYGLTDTPADLPTGVALVDGTTWTVEAQQDLPAGTVFVPTKPATGDWEFASGRVPAGEVFEFLISATITVDASAVQSTEGCDAEEVGIALRNDLGIVSGVVETDDPSCVRVPPPATWTLEKTSDPASGSTVKAGSDVTYTLVVTNTGEGTLFDAIVKDDLGDVLKNATLKGSLAAELALSGSTLTWEVPPVPEGSSVSVSYTVTVKKNVAGVAFKNVATPESPGGTCVADQCSTNHNVPPVPPASPKPPKPQLPKTGAAIGTTLLGAAILGAIGIGLKRRSRREL